MKKNLLVFFIFLISKTILSQSSYPWAVSMPSYVEGLAVCTDPSGNVCCSGDYFVSKYTSSGAPIWTKTLTAVSFGNSEIPSIATDNSGNIFITGYYTGPGIIIGTFTLTNNSTSNYNNSFIAKFDPNGNALWAKSIGGTDDDASNSIAVDASGNAFITGYFTSPSVTFGTYTLTNPGSSSNAVIFYAKYDPSGNVLWAQQSLGITGGDGNAITTDALGNCYVGGTYSGPTITFGTYTLTGNGDPFLIKCNPSGNVLWAKSHTSSCCWLDMIEGLTTDANNNIYATGSYQSTSIAFGTYTLTNTSIGPVKYFFLAKYDSNGNVLWVKDGGGNTDLIGYSVSTNTNGVFVSGTYGAGNTFTNSSVTIGVTTYTPPPGSIDPMFIATYDSLGNLLCSDVLTSGGDDQNCITSDKFGNTYVFGDFLTPTFVVGSTTLTISASETAFLAKYLCTVQPQGVTVLDHSQTIKIYPNPNNGAFKLQSDHEAENSEIILFNIIGQKVFSQKIKQGDNEIKTQGLVKGLYHYSILQNKIQLKTGKIVIE